MIFQAAAILYGYCSNTLDTGFMMFKAAASIPNPSLILSGPKTLPHRTCQYRNNYTLLSRPSDDIQQTTAMVWYGVALIIC